MTNKIPRYNRIDQTTPLGNNAELFCDHICYDVSGMNFRELLVVYEADILKADKAWLKSDTVGNWHYNKDRRQWERK